MTTSPTHRSQRQESGFSLLELLVCITILAIAIFPLLLVKEQSYADAIDAKMSRISRNHIQRLFSEATLDLDDRETRRGDLGEYGFPDITWEMECRAIDLSTEIEDASTRDGESDENERWGDNKPDLFDGMDDEDQREEDDQGLFYDEEEEEIDPRFKYRHIVLTIRYVLFGGEKDEEVEIISETYLPPLPVDEDDIFSDNYNRDRSDLVPPNNG